MRDQRRFFQEKFFSTRDDFKILAVGGKHFEGSVLIVLEDMRYEFTQNDDPVAITTGALYFTGCPWPQVTAL